MNALLLGIHAAGAGPISVEADGSVSRRFCFSCDFAGFDGHFPGAPILPAVVQIQMAVAMAGAQSKTPLRLVAVESAKFLAPVQPGQEILVRLRPCEIGGKPMHDAVLTVAGKTASSFLLQLAPEGEPA